jgi:hypothetical protein
LPSLSPEEFEHAEGIRVAIRRGKDRAILLIQLAMSEPRYLITKT